VSFSVNLLKQCWFLTGPTASGKTATGIALARQINAEIVSLDSMALYRRMNIGTAKPTTQEQAQVPHHLIDLYEPDEECSVAEYIKHAGRVCTDILNRGKTPLFVGGTGLYLRSLLRGVFDGPPANWELRRQLEEESRQQTVTWLHEQLMSVDPVSAQRLPPGDTRRIIRAIEVYRITGQPASEQQQQAPRSTEERPVVCCWLHPPRAWLYDRINQRVDLMLQQGLLEEVQALLEEADGLSRTAVQGLGYKEIISHLRGESSLSDALESLKTRTRQFAKRQHTWFRNLEECHELEISGTETPQEIADNINAMQ